MDIITEDFVIIKTDDGFILPPTLHMLLKKSTLRCLTIYVTTNTEQIMKFMRLYDTPNGAADNLMPALELFANKYIQMIMQNGSTELTSDAFEEAVLEYMDEHIRREVNKAE